MKESCKNKTDSASNSRYTFTVFTPTYNRARTLNRVYGSLQKQTFHDLEWLIIDDGSSDNTAELVKAWQKEAGFPIRYLWQENQGINAAVNEGVNLAQGKFFLLIGSDDSFVPEALEKFIFYWEAIPEEKRDQFVGVSALCQDQYGNLVGDRFPSEVLDSDSMEIRYKFKVKGEKWGFLRTDVFRQFPFPVIPETKFVPEGIIWSAVARRFKTRFINVPLRIYWEDESNQSDQLTKISLPGKYAKGHALWHLSRLNHEINWFFNDPKEFFRSAVHYGRFSFHTGEGIFRQFAALKNNPARCLWFLMLPVAIGVFLRDPRK